MAAGSPWALSAAPHVAVIGGGIVGCSIAYHLAKSGARVTLIEQHALATGASHGTFAWINATWAKQPRHYHQFSQAGVKAWRRLEHELTIPVKWGGSLEWFASATRQQQLLSDIKEQIAWGEPARMVAKERLEQLEPNVDFSGTSDAAFSPNDGAVNPVLAATIMARAAAGLGAVIKEQCHVKSATELPSGQVMLHTSAGMLAIDRYVLATGASEGMAQQLADIALPQRSTPGVIVITAPQPPLLNRIVVAPGVHIHQRQDGRIVLGEQDGAPATTAHVARLKGRPRQFPNTALATAHAQRMLTIAGTVVPGLGSAVVEEVIIGWRPLPLDGLPVIGSVPRKRAAYVAIMHSGVSLAPHVGDVVAREIMTGQSVPALKDYRPERHFMSTGQY